MSGPARRGVAFNVILDDGKAHGRWYEEATDLRASPLWAWARGAGHRAVTLTTFRDIPWNAPFYESAGFRPLGAPEVGPGLAAIVRDEAARGLDPGQRLAMRRELAIEPKPR